MASYKNHLIFPIVISLLATAPFFPHVFYLALSVVGASVIDLDHPIRYRNLFLMGFSGFLLLIILYLLHMSLFLGLILILTSLIFLVSSHRGFMHSIIGVIIISLLLTVFSSTAFSLMTTFSISTLPALVLISVSLGIIILNKQIVPFYVILVLMGMYIFPNPMFNVYFVFMAFLLGGLSHIALDIFSGKGVKLFYPLSKRRFGKKMVIVLITLWLLTIFYFYGFFNLIRF